MRRNTANAPAASLHDPTALAGFGKLEITTRMLVEGDMIGQHKSPNKGTSIEFAEHRRYSPGDEPRHIDWRAYGKTGRYFIKEFEDETNVRCYILLDASGSMSYSGRTLSKFAYARQLAAALSYLLLRQRDAVGLLTFDTEIRTRCEPSARSRTFPHLIELLESSEPGGETGLASVCERIRPTLKRRSLIILLSDCFDRVEDVLFAFRQWRHSRHEVIAMQIVAPEEEEFPFHRPSQFRSLELRSNRKLVDPHRLRAHYLQQFREFCTRLSQGCGNLQIDYQRLRTDQPYQDALGPFIASRNRR